MIEQERFQAWVKATYPQASRHMVHHMWTAWAEATGMTKTGDAGHHVGTGPAPVKPKAKSKPKAKAESTASER